MDRHEQIKIIEVARNMIMDKRAHTCCAAILFGCSMTSVRSKEWFGKEAVLPKFREFVANSDIPTLIDKRSLRYPDAIDFHWWEIGDRKSRINALTLFIEHLKQGGDNDNPTGQTRPEGA